MSIEDQNAAVSAPLLDMSIVAGAGSGKTKTAIARVLSTLDRLPPLCKIALLSFSNVAVNTFRHGLAGQGRDLARVTVATFDSFFTQHVTTPYAWQLMACAERPFLVLGDEPFLNGFSITHGGRPYNISELKIRKTVEGYQASLGSNQVVPWPVAQAAIESLGRTGAYTYDMARYWAHLTLARFPYLVRLIVTRYPHMMVDEAQDIGSLDWAILQLLRDQGLQLALIGDPAQAIFGFNGGDGGYLRSYIGAAGVNYYALSTNFRSVPPIVFCANRLSGRADVADRVNLPTHGGAFIVPYDSAAPRRVLDRFQGTILRLGYSLKDIAVICRANSLVAQVRGGTINRGAGLVKGFVKAADNRIANEYHLAYKECMGVVGALLEPPVPRFRAVMEEALGEGAKQVQAKIWRFVCDHENGLPHSHLNARDVWLPRLLLNTRSLLNSLSAHGLTFADPGRRITVRDLDANPVVGPRDHVRIDTVHQVKGESIGAVLYIATERHAQELFGGVGTENGRIGYVALTRAKDIFWLAVPTESYERLVQQAAGVGIMRIPSDV